MAMAGAGAITHSMVPPTPGPLMIAEFLSIELGHALIAGLVASVPIAVLVLWVSGWFDERMEIQMRPVAGIGNDDLKDFGKGFAGVAPFVPFLFAHFASGHLDFLCISLKSFGRRGNESRVSCSEFGESKFSNPFLFFWVTRI